MNSVIVCGVNRTENGAFKCPCCGYVSRSLDEFATSMCWACVAGNIDCANCFRDGVPIDKFSDRRGKMHRLSGWDGPEDDERRYALTACGMSITFSDLGQSIAVKTQCQHCWK